MARQTQTKITNQEKTGERELAIPHSRSYGGGGGGGGGGGCTSFRRNDFWDLLDGQTLAMIGYWYSRQPLTNHK